LPCLERTREVADDHDVPDAPDDAERYLEALVVLDVHEVLVEFAHDEGIHLLPLDVEDDVFDLAHKDTLLRVNIQAKQLRNLGSHPNHEKYIL